MREKKRTSLVESLEVRKVLAQGDWEWSRLADEFRHESDSYILAATLADQDSKPSLGIKENVSKVKKLPRQASHGLVGEGEGGSGNALTGVANPSAVGSASQQNQVDQERDLVTAIQGSSVREALAQSNSSLAWIDLSPERIDSSTAQQTTQSDRLFVSDKNQFVRAPMESFVWQAEQEDRMAPNGMNGYGLGGNSPFELIQRILPRRSLAVESYSAVDRLMSNSSEDRYWWSEPSEWFDGRDTGVRTQESSSLQTRSIFTNTSKRGREAPWESVFHNGLPTPKGMVYLEVGELAKVTAAGAPTLTNLATWQPSPFGLLQWFAGGAKEPHRVDPDQLALDRTEMDMEAKVSSAKECTAGVLLMILAGICVSERARRKRGEKSIASRLICLAMYRMGSSRMLETRDDRNWRGRLIGEAQRSQRNSS